MKKIITSSLLIGILLASCQKDHPVSNDFPNEFGLSKNALTSDSARIEFSKILSKAVFNEPELRNFIKAEAINRFDNDYDVFYAFVKDEIVKEGKTFREVLLDYTDDSFVLENIEDALPLLNIYVPDLTAFFEFSAENWNTGDNEIVVTPLNSDDQQAFYGNGELMFSLDLSEIPGFPCLVVKNNERVKLKENIKVKGAAGRLSYEFIDDAFDKRLNTKSSPATSTINKKLIVDAWTEFGVDPNYWQRDYIYYNMTKANPAQATINPQIREYIEMIKFEPSIIPIISDQTGDPFLKNDHVHKSDDRNPLTFAQISRALWTDGAFEFNIYVTKGIRTGEQNSPQKIVLSIAPTDIFRFRNIKHKIKGGGLFHRDRHTYWIESSADIESKPYFPYNGAGIPLEKWEIANESMNLNFQIFERDDSEAIEKNYSVKNTYANSANFKLDLGLGELIKKVVKLDLGFGVTTNKSTERTESLKISTTKTSDDLGNLTLYFSDPILTTTDMSMSIDGSPYYFYMGHMLRNGAVTMQVLPKRL